MTAPTRPRRKCPGCQTCILRAMKVAVVDGRDLHRCPCARWWRLGPGPGGQFAHWLTADRIDPALRGDVPPSP